MYFAFTDQQLEFQESVRQLLTQECTTDDVRAAFDTPLATSARWHQLCELGVVGLMAHESRGGLGMGLRDLVLLLEEAGRAGLPEPLADTAGVAIPVLEELASSNEAVVSDVISAVAAGEASIAVGRASGGDHELVAGAQGADWVLLPRLIGPEQWEVYLLSADAVTVAPVASLDPTRRLATLTWSPIAEAKIASGSEAAAAVVRLRQRGAVTAAATLLGLSERMISMTVEYTAQRTQFGQVVGSFQAVKHLMAGARVALEFARPAVYAAAWALDVGDPETASAVATAKATASDAATEAARVALQAHGAIGYTWECDLHLFSKRAWAIAEEWGSAAAHRRTLLAELLSSAAR